MIQNYTTHQYFKEAKNLKLKSFFFLIQTISTYSIKEKLILDFVLYLKLNRVLHMIS